MEDVVATAQRKFYEKYPNPTHWTSSAVDEFVFKVVESVRLICHLELKKQLSIADAGHTPMFIEQVKSQYETHNVNPEMTQEKLWMLVTSAMDNSMKFKWLERWNNSTTFHETFKFLKSKFNDIEFLKWLHKATWWALMIIFLVLLFFGL